MTRPVIVLDPAKLVSGVDVDHQAEYLQDQGYTVVWGEAGAATVLGMSRRDTFAAAAMRVQIQSNIYLLASHEERADLLAQLAVLQADALIRELDKEPPQ